MSNRKHYEIVEFLTSVLDHLDSFDGDTFVIPESKRPIFKKLVHDSIGLIIYELMCIDKAVNPELITFDDSKECDDDENRINIDFK